MKMAHILAGFAALATVSGGLAAVGLSLPQIATQEHIEDHARDDAEALGALRDRLAQVDLMTTQQALESAELRALRLEQEAQRQREAGDDPALIDREVQILKRRTRGLDARVQCLLQNPGKPEACP